MSTKEVGASTTMMIILFGVNACLYLFFQYIAYMEKKDLPEEMKTNPDAPKKKELSKPFTLTLDGFTKLTSDLMWLGAIMALTYICENHWIFPHSQKEYSRDLFMFIVILFFIYGYYTIEPVKDLTLLSRDQTEEWKGWMQFIFLLYHCKSN